MSLMIHPRIALYAQFAAVSMKAAMDQQGTMSQAAERAWQNAATMMAEMPGDLKAQLADDIRAYEAVRGGILDDAARREEAEQ